MQALNVADMRGQAKRRLPKAIFEFIDGGAQDERTLAANRTDFDRWTFAPRYMVDVTTRDLSTTVLGTHLSAPIITAPTGLAGLARRHGELLAARAAERAGIGFCLSCMASVSLERIAAARSTPFWFQIYILRDRGVVEAILQRAKAVGCTALFVTIDTPVIGQRERDARNGMTVPPRVTAANALDMLQRWSWLADVAAGPRLEFANVAPHLPAARDLTTVARLVNGQMDASLTWKDLDWIKRVWGGPVGVKGVLTADDARRAVDSGADAVVVSNHGGRQMDGAVSSIAALPRVADAVGDRCEVLLDSGIRRGNDVLKALALGAKAVMIGRPYLWGVAAGAEAGVGRALDLLKGEGVAGLALLGRTELRTLDPSVFVDREPGRNLPA